LKGVWMYRFDFTGRYRIMLYWEALDSSGCWREALDSDSTISLCLLMFLSLVAWHENK
jgi:hypothetical protein